METTPTRAPKPPGTPDRLLFQTVPGPAQGPPAPQPPAFSHAIVAIEEPSADTAVISWARALAHAFETRLTLVHVGIDAATVTGYGTTDWSDRDLFAHEVETHARDLLAAAAEALAPVTSPLDTVFRTGVAGDELAELADERGADIVLIGSHQHGRLARAFLGSTAERVKAHVDGSLLVAKRPALPASILVAVDGTDAGRRAALAAIRLAAQWDASLTLLRVIEGTILDLETEPDALLASASGLKLDALPVAVTTALEFGEPAHRILETARAIDADLIVMGARRTGGLRALLTGSVSSRVVPGADASVLLVRGVEHHPAML